MRTYGIDLPEYPWEALAPYRAIAAEHPGGTVDLSIGTPVDSTPQLIQDALAAGANAHGYPTTHGTLELRQAIVDWFARRRNVHGLSTDQVMPTVGSKELVAWLPFLLGLGPHPETGERDVVVYPRAAYPTYEIGARLAGADHYAADSLTELPEDVKRRVRLVWVNSPANPNGVVRGVEQLRELVRHARDIGAVVASDECYAELGWGEWDTARGGKPVPSILDERVCAGDFTGLFAAYSLSKQSNLAGYRAAFIAGDAQIMPNIINTRKHAGMIVPWRQLPPQAGESKAPKRACTCGPRSVRAPGNRSSGWRNWVLWPAPECSTERAATAMCASPSPPRMRQSLLPQNASKAASHSPCPSLRGNASPIAA